MAQDKHSQKSQTDLMTFNQNPQLGIGPEEQSAYGAFGCFKEKSSLQLFKEDMKNLSPDKMSNKKRIVLEQSAGRGHGSVDDQNSFTFAVENLTRASTLLLCAPEYISHLQQSLRRATADRGFFLPKELRQPGIKERVVEVLSDAFNLYVKMAQLDVPEKERDRTAVPGEDARELLPLYTKTNIQTTTNAREFKHVLHMSRYPFVPPPVKADLQAMADQMERVAPNLVKEMSSNYEVLAWYPSSQLFGEMNQSLSELIMEKGEEAVVMLDWPRPESIKHLTSDSYKQAIHFRNEAELSNLKHIHYTFLYPISLSGFHQATRQRTWNHAIEWIYTAIQRGDYIVPPSIRKSDYCKDYIEQNERMFDLHFWLTNKKGVSKPSAIGVSPHSLVVYDQVHVNGWNAIHSIGKRTCKDAQWQIRAIAQGMANHIKEDNPLLGEYVAPQGELYGSCPERVPCPSFEKNGKCAQVKKSIDPKIFEQYNYEGIGGDTLDD